MNSRIRDWSIGTARRTGVRTGVRTGMRTGLRRGVFYRVCLGLCLALAPTPLLAIQQTATINGTVEDDATARQLDNVDIAAVLISGGAAAPISTQTSVIGRFTLKLPAPGRYRLTFRRLGYVPLTVEHLAVSGDISELVFRMSRTAQQLNALAIADSISGIAGIVGVAKTYQPVSNAVVQIAGARAALKTDSLGRFFAQVEKPGTYAVRVSHPIFGTIIQSAVVERKAIVELAVMLDSATPRIPEIFWKDLDQRQRWRRMTSAMVSGADLLRSGGGVSTGLRLNAGFTQSGMRVGTAICLFVNGVARPGWTLDAIAPESIAFIELYGASGEGSGTLARQWPRGIPCTELPGRQSRPSGELLKYAVVWMR